MGADPATYAAAPPAEPALTPIIRLARYECGHYDVASGTPRLAPGQTWPSATVVVEMASLCALCAFWAGLPYAVTARVVMTALAQHPPDPAQAAAALGPVVEAVTAALEIGRFRAQHQSSTDPASDVAST